MKLISQELLFRFTLDSATEFFFGRSVKTLRQSGEAGKKFGGAFNYSVGGIAVKFRLGPLRMFRRNLKAIEPYKFCWPYVGQFAKTQCHVGGVTFLKNPSVAGKGASKNVFLEELAKATDDKN